MDRQIEREREILRDINKQMYGQREIFLFRKRERKKSPNNFKTFIKLTHLVLTKDLARRDPNWSNFGLVNWNSVRPGEQWLTVATYLY